MSFFGKYYFSGSRPASDASIDDLFSRPGSGDAAAGAWCPACDIYETDDGIVVRMEAPGVRREELEVFLAGETLTVRGRRCDACARSKRAYRQMEIHYGPFERVLALPGSITARGATARLEDGMLEVFLSRAPASTPPPVLVKIRWEGVKRKP